MLDIKNISKTFNPGTVNEKRALTDLSLHLERGDFATIVGSNGAGKSTLFNAIAGCFYADTGSISLAGRDITFTPEHQRSRVIGRLFQDPLRGTAPHMTIEKISRSRICAPRTETPSAAYPAPIRKNSAHSCRCWIWGLRIVCGSRSACCRAVSARR